MVLSDRRFTVGKSFREAVIRRQSGAGGRSHPSEGSVLVVVLWVLILVGFLVGEYSAHNREKAEIARNAWTALRQRLAVTSITELFSTDDWPIPDSAGVDGHWFRLFPDGQDVWVRVDKESARVNLNTANDGEVKQKIALMRGDGFQREMDAVSDAILDWRDEDDLVRMHGAEDNAYLNRGLSYKPANGPLNSMTELLLIQGVTPDLFWGDPIRMIEADLNRQDVEQAQDLDYKSLSETATIYEPTAKRISLAVVGQENGYLYKNVFMTKESGRQKIVGSQEVLMVAEAGFDGLIELEAEVNGLDARGKRRR